MTGRRVVWPISTGTRASVVRVAGAHRARPGGLAGPPDTPSAVGGRGDRSVGDNAPELLDVLLEMADQEPLDDPADGHVAEPRMNAETASFRH